MGDAGTGDLKPTGKQAAKCQQRLAHRHPDARTDATNRR